MKYCKSCAHRETDDDANFSTNGIVGINCCALVAHAFTQDPFCLRDSKSLVEVDRNIGEAANKLCVRFSDNRLRPADAIHLASALRAGCDVLLTWDGPLAGVNG